MQEAVASGLEKVKSNNFFEIQRNEYEERRNILVDTFKKLGMQYTFPEGSYFLLVVGHTGLVSVLPSDRVIRTFRMLTSQMTIPSPTRYTEGDAISSEYCAIAGSIHLTRFQGLLVHSPRSWSFLHSSQRGIFLSRPF